jgi:dTDP-glucose 4,6-dehydratase
LEDKKRFCFHLISTDEVFGSLGKIGSFDENTSYDPRSPYSASKASADHIVRAWSHTFNLPYLITNCSNNYGPFQHPEKLIPATIINALGKKPINIYGKGDNIRDWLYVQDHADALWKIVTSSKRNETYCIGSNNEKTNLEVVHEILFIMNQMRIHEDGFDLFDLITFVEDRPGHDLRYAIDASKLENDLAWKSSEAFDSGIKKTIDWYVNNLDWCESVLGGEISLNRIGLRK